jgi:hypothetical protein
MVIVVYGCEYKKDRINVWIRYSKIINIEDNAIIDDYMCILVFILVCWWESTLYDGSVIYIWYIMNDVKLELWYNGNSMDI